MNFEYAIWQIPQRVFRNFKYCKCSQQQWARNGPAFQVQMMGFLVFTSLGLSMSWYHTVQQKNRKGKEFTIFRFLKVVERTAKQGNFPCR
ncbi:unnamed protein product [Trichobilharzia regenti]|nr:unnamed protein product [Trichobilharzia regenti]